MSKIIKLWHGGNLDDIKADLSHKSGRYEYGAGLYLTSSYEVVKKYSKGSRKLYLVTVKEGNSVDNTKLNFDACKEFINTNTIKAKISIILERMGKYVDSNGEITARYFNNIILNEKAISSSKTNLLRQFLVDNNVDYEMVGNAFGFSDLLLVLYNNSKIVEVNRVHSKDIYGMDDFELSTSFN